MKFPIVIHKDKDSNFGVIIPDLPGCHSYGETMDHAIDNAEEAILCHIEGLISDKESIPQPQSLDVHKKNKKYKNATWAVASVDLEKISGKAKRINITIPERILSQIDEYSHKSHETRSGLLAQAAMEYIYNHKVN